MKENPASELSDRMLDLLEAMKLYDRVQESRVLLLARLLRESKARLAA